MGMRAKVGKLFMSLLAIQPEEDDDLLREEVSWDEARLDSLLKEARELVQLSEKRAIEEAEPVRLEEERAIEEAEPMTLEEKPAIEEEEPVRLEEQPALQAADPESSEEETSKEAVQEGDAKSGMDDDIFDVFTEEEIEDASFQAVLQDLDEVDVDCLLRESQAIAEQLGGNH